MTTPPTEHLPTARYRAPADGRSDAAVLAAALAELRDRGYAGASLRTIAARADVPLETIFRRWRSKQRVLMAAIVQLADDQPAPETGNLRADLVQVAEAFGALLEHPGTVEALRSLLSTADVGPSASPSLRAGPLGQRRSVVRRIVERGQRRQELSASLHPGVVADALLGALLFRMLAGEPVTGDVTARIVDIVLAAETPFGTVGGT